MVSFEHFEYSFYNPYKHLQLKFNINYAIKLYFPTLLISLFEKYCFQLGIFITFYALFFWGGWWGGGGG